MNDENLYGIKRGKTAKVDLAKMIVKREKKEMVIKANKKSRTSLKENMKLFVVY